MTDVATFTEDDLATTLDKLRAFSDTLAPCERAALNAIGELASLGAAVAATEGAGESDDAPEVEGFAIITGTQTRPGSSGGSGGSSGGSSGGRPSPYVVPLAGVPGGMPIPYPNIGGVLGSKFPF